MISMIQERLKGGLSFCYNYKFTILLAIYICLIAFYPQRSSFEVSSFSIAQFLGALSIVCILHILVKTKYTFPLTILLTLVIIFNAYFSFVLGATSINLGIIASILETDLNEATSVLGGRVFPILGVIIVTVVIVYLASRELRQSLFRRRISLLIVFLYAFSLLPVLTYRRILLTDLRFNYHKSSLFYTQIVVNQYSPVLYGNVITLASYINEATSLSNAFDSERFLKEGMTKSNVVSDSLRVNKIYFVIGESATREHMSLYNYGVKTTPFLDSLAHCDTANFAYYYALSSGTITRNALPMIVTTSSPQDRLAFGREKSLLDLAKDAGYDTYWLSNHPSIDGWDIQMGGFLSKISRMAQNVEHTSSAYGEDLEVVSLLNKVRNSKSTVPQFFVLHLAGSHDSYSDRYDEIDRQQIHGEGQIVDYDRSIHHTDRVLREVYKIMKQDESSILIYMPDHGENVGAGHGFSMVKSQFQVPLVTINNSHYPINFTVCKYLDTQRVESAELMNINLGSVMYIASEILGYDISDDLLKHVVDDGRYVFHEDQVLPYKTVFEGEKAGM